MARTHTMIRNATMCDAVRVKKDGTIEIARGYFYSGGCTSDKFASRVSDDLTKAGIAHTLVGHQDIWKSFRGGAGTWSSTRWVAVIRLK